MEDFEDIQELFKVKKMSNIKFIVNIIGLLGAVGGGWYKLESRVSALEQEIEKQGEIKTNDTCEFIISSMQNPPKIVREINSDRAYYVPVADKVVMPNLNDFDTNENFYYTMFHELGHSTGHKDRLNRFGKAPKAFEDNSLDVNAIKKG